MPFSAGREMRLLAASVQMLTRVPVRTGPPQADWLARSAKYFPLIGLAVGAVSGAVHWLAGLVWPQPLPAFLAVAAGLILTGALHEDGLADSADSIGGRSREQKLAIMKDPRIGTFGVLALGLTVALKVAVLASMGPMAAFAALIAAGAVSRFWSVALMARASYGGDRLLAKVDHGIEGPAPREVALALSFALAPLVMMDLSHALPALLASTAAATLVAIPLCRALGGYTGDVLGAIVALSETAFLLGAAAQHPWA